MRLTQIERFVKNVRAGTFILIIFIRREEQNTQLSQDSKVYGLLLA
jgi:hypothetical protein